MYILRCSERTGVACGLICRMASWMAVAAPYFRSKVDNIGLLGMETSGVLCDMTSRSFKTDPRNEKKVVAEGAEAVMVKITQEKIIICVNKDKVNVVKKGF